MPVSIETAADIALKFYEKHPEILCCDENSKLIGGWLKDSGLSFSARNLEEALSDLGEQVVRKYSEEEIQKMTGDQYKRLVLPYCSDVPEDLRNQLKPRTLDPIELLSSAEIRDQIVIPEWKARQVSQL